MAFKSPIPGGWLLLAGFLLLLAGCDTINPEEEVPSYIHIDSINLVDDANNPTGTVSHNIEDAWVFSGGQFIGTFQLPATVPILQSGQKDLVIRAGIKNNGISNTRVSYPFYDTIQLKRSLQRREVDSLGVLSTSYLQSAKFEWVERFEDTGDVSLRNNSNATVPFELTSDPEEVNSGRFSLKAELEEEGDFFEAKLPQRRAVQLSGNNNIYLEVNFRCDVRFQMGFTAVAPNGNTTQRSKLILNETQGRWKKVYINLKENVQRFPKDHRFQIYFGKVKREGGPSRTLYLDNLKLITR